MAVSAQEDAQTAASGSALGFARPHWTMLAASGLCGAGGSVLRQWAAQFDYYAKQGEEKGKGARQGPRFGAHCLVGRLVAPRPEAR